MTTTTTTSRSRRTTPTGTVIQADETPRIADLLPGMVIYRWANTRALLLVSELPCHRDQMASVTYDPNARAIQADQPVVCRRCFTTYAATPVPATQEFAWYRIVYRHTGHITMSRPKRSGEPKCTGA